MVGFTLGHVGAHEYLFKQHMVLLSNFTCGVFFRTTPRWSGNVEMIAEIIEMLFGKF